MHTLNTLATRREEASLHESVPGHPRVIRPEQAVSKHRLSQAGIEDVASEVFQLQAAA